MNYVLANMNGGQIQVHGYCIPNDATHALLFYVSCTGRRQYVYWYHGGISPGIKEGCYLIARD
jgi:hypothetical protein